MEPDRWRQIEQLYHVALEREKSVQAAFVAKACGGDEALRREVEFLLAQGEQAGSFLESPAIEVMAESLAKDERLSDPAKPAVEIGAMVAHYRLTEKIGEGGMGEVYRARDTKLGRDVALKILPQAMARDAQRMARFEREAQVLASLNHPNIAAIYGLEESNGIRALVMELVEGETLAEKTVWEGSALPREPQGLPYLDVLPIAKQIAEALEYAHEHGVIHRDLKPANVKITPEGAVKVLDFGLAKVLGGTGGSPLHGKGVHATDQDSPTLTTLGTQPGTIIGTAAYMSPEQAKGQRVDRRADIWAFGCVLFEMLSGRKPFRGETVSDVLAAVLMKEPEWNTLPETTPKAIQKLIHRCLVKDPKQRLRDIGEVRITIEETLSGGAGERSALPRESEALPDTQLPKSPIRRVLPWALAATGILGCVILGFVVIYLLNGPETEQPVIRFSVLPPQNTQFGDFVLSPGGLELAFIGLASGNGAESEVWVRPLDQLIAQPLQGTEGAESAFWSPDGRYVGFFADGKLKKISASGGPVQALCDAVGLGGTWSSQGVIVFSNNGMLYRVPDTGGEPTLIAAPDPARQEHGFWRPQFLPDGRHFIFQVFATSDEISLIRVGSLDSKQTERLLGRTSNALYSPPGYLLYVQQNNLVARRFDAGRLRFTGEAVPIAQLVAASPDPGDVANLSTSENGVLAYRPNSGGSTNRMMWFDRKGKEIGTIGPPGLYTNPALSPDGSKVAVGVGVMGSRDIWVYDLKRDESSRLTLDPADDLCPVWSHDGSTIMFTSTPSGQRDLYEKPANGLGTTHLVYASKGQAKNLMDWSMDGRYALYDTSGGLTNLWALPLFGDRKPFALVEGNYFATQGRFSPDGRYIAYTSNETGRSEVYVQTFPQHLGKGQVSTSGGTEPMWRRNGKELFYLKPDSTVMSVQVGTRSGEFQAGVPKPLFRTQLITGGWRNRYVVSPDGPQFLMLVPAVEAKPQPITVVVNWPALLKKQ